MQHFTKSGRYFWVCTHLTCIPFYAAYLIIPDFSVDTLQRSPGNGSERSDRPSTFGIGQRNQTQSCGQDVVGSNHVVSDQMFVCSRDSGSEGIPVVCPDFVVSQFASGKFELRVQLGRVGVESV